MIKNSILVLFFLFPLVLNAGEVPIDRNYLELPNGQWIWLKKVGVHKTWIILGKGRKSIHNKIWSKFYESNGNRHTWSYAFFVKLKPKQFVIPDDQGNPQVAISTYDMGNGVMRWAIIFRVLKDRLEIVGERDNFNVEADESIFDKKPLPRDLHPHLKITDIQKWIGKYPFDKIEGTDLFTTKFINDYLRIALGNSKYTEFLSVEDIGPQTPVEINNGIIHFTVCQKHNCGHTFYFLFDVKSKELFICERELDLEPKSPKTSFGWRVNWFSEKGTHSIPEGHCEVYDEKTKETDWRRTLESIPSFLKK